MTQILHLIKIWNDLIKNIIKIWNVKFLLFSKQFFRLTFFQFFIQFNANLFSINCVIIFAMYIQFKIIQLWLNFLITGSPFYKKWKLFCWINLLSLFQIGNFGLKCNIFLSRSVLYKYIHITNILFNSTLFSYIYRYYI